MSRTPGRKNGEVRAAFNALALLETDECVLWPYSTNSKGYGLVGIDGKVSTVHSLVCEAHSGPRPTGYHAAHYCGVKTCMNHRHIRWATPKENEQDKAIHRLLAGRGAA